MLEYTNYENTRKRITIFPEYLQSLEEANNGQQTYATMISGQVHFLDAPYETVRTDVAEAIGIELEEDFEEDVDNDFLGSH